MARRYPCRLKSAARFLCWRAVRLACRLFCPIPWILDSFYRTAIRFRLRLQIVNEEAQIYDFRGSQQQSPAASQLQSAQRLTLSRRRPLIISQIRYKIACRVTRPEGALNLCASSYCPNGTNANGKLAQHLS